LPSTTSDQIESFPPRGSFLEGSGGKAQPTEAVGPHVPAATYFSNFSAENSFPSLAISID